MGRDRMEISGAAVKAFLAAAAALAIAVGLALPVPHRDDSTSQPKSQFSTLELGRG
jgi:hypothetical protein